MEVEEAVSIATRSSSANNGKNDIKVSEDGVAKLTFGFLDDMQGGDSSLEPGEVKTPPPGSSPASTKDSTPMRTTKPAPPSKQLAREALAKAMKTVSQMEAEACEEKVRLILELDAKRRREEKLLIEKQREKEEDKGETSKKSKDERKSTKKHKKSKFNRLVQITLLNTNIVFSGKKSTKKDSKESDSDDSEGCKSLPKKPKTSKLAETDESEGLCSSGDEDSDKYVEKVSSVVVTTSNAPSNRFTPHIVHPPHPSHLPPEAFMGYRNLNPFMRGARMDFPHGRGGFIPRGRGGIRGGRMPFPGFRPPFFNAGGGGGISGPLARHHGPQHRQQHHTPPPNRGHSPILPPSTNLM